MTDRERMIEIMQAAWKAAFQCPFDQKIERMADALIKAGYLNFTEGALVVPEYAHLEKIAKTREEALIIMAKRAISYAEKAKIPVTTSDGWFGCEKNVQIALLVDDVMREARKKEKTTDCYCRECEFFEDKSTGNLIDGYCKKHSQPVALDFCD